jgi:ribonuclease BN (tRNA processing enzyme)
MKHFVKRTRRLIFNTVDEWQALQATHVFISHSHIDHIGSLLSHARARTLMKNPARYYVPQATLAPLLKVSRNRLDHPCTFRHAYVSLWGMQAKEAFEEMDGGEPFAAEIIAVKPGASGCCEMLFSVVGLHASSATSSEF